MDPTPDPSPGKPPAPSPAPAPPARDTVDPMRASVRIQCGGAGCSGTLIRLDTSDQYYLLTCAHCIPRTQPPVRIFGDGWQLTGQVTRIDRKIDIALVRVNERGRDKPIAELATSPPTVGERVWHHGFGVDRPGNVERGTVLQAGNTEYACWYTTRLSNGDSGSGQFRESDGRLIALGAWSYGSRYGGPSLAQIRQFLGTQTPPSTPPGYGPG